MLLHLLIVLFTYEDCNFFFLNFKNSLNLYKISSSSRYLKLFVYLVYYISIILIINKIQVKVIPYKWSKTRTLKIFHCLNEI